MWLPILCVAVCTVLFYLSARRYNHWKNKEIPYTKPLYFFGNFLSNVLRTKSLIDIVKEAYPKFPNNRYFGMYQFRLPVLVIRDPELVKQITVKDFDVFPEHNRVFPSNVEPLFSKNLFNMQHDEGWHDMRATLSPSFTSSKMRMIFNIMEQISSQFISYYKKSNSEVCVEIKDAFARLANDIIGSSAFGVTCNSLQNKENEFYLMGKDVTNFSGFKSLKLFTYFVSPFLGKLLNVRLISDKADKFFRNLITETLRIRKEEKVVRADMINLLLEAQKKTSISDEDITAQALVFFFAGFDVTSSAMTYLTYQLALNPEIQQRLYEEIFATLDANGGQISYETIMSMKYLDCVISESLRINPSVPFLDRRCVKPYTIEPKLPHEKPLHLEKGTIVWIPSSAIHFDEQYFPNPNKFDPERFNADNKHNIKPFTYMPFGSGPRNCIGSRFALMEIKLVMLKLLQHFEIIPNEKTQIPLQVDKTSFNNLPKEGVWVSFKPREVKELPL